MVGLTVLVNPVVPSFQVTEPEQFETVKVAELPAQIEDGFAVTDGVGGGVTVTLFVTVQPLQSLTVTV